MRGHAFTGPAGEKYRNLGKLQLVGRNEAGRATAASFHIAEGVSQALGSVAESNDAGNLLAFDSSGGRDGSLILKADSEEGKAIRAATERALSKGAGTIMHRVKNNYITKM